MSTANTHAGGTQSKIKIDQMLRKLQQRNSTHLIAIFLLVKQFAIHHHQLYSFTSYAVLFILVHSCGYIVRLIGDAMKSIVDELEITLSLLINLFNLCCIAVAWSPHVGLLFLWHLLSRWHLLS